MNKIEYIFIAIAIIMATALIALNRQVDHLQEERDRYRENTESLMESVDEYRVRDSLQAASVIDLNLTLKEYKKYREEDARIIEDLRVDNKRLNKIITTQTSGYYEHTAVLRDSIEFLKKNSGDTIAISKRTATFADEWHKIELVISNDSVNYKLRTCESLLITNHVVPKRFLWIRFGCKSIRTEVVSLNPYVDNIQIESITLQ